MEKFWAYLKMNPLANHATTDTRELRNQAARHSRRLGQDQKLLRSFVAATPLSLRLK